jgi:hypothetical protein
MGSYMCPICDGRVPPVGFDRPADAVAGDDGRFEVRGCPECGARLQRELLGSWHRATPSSPPLAVEPELDAAHR